MDHLEPGRLEPGRLEQELRDVLTHERRALSTDLVSLDAVYAGAARRRRRRTAVVAAAGAFALVAVALPLSLSLIGDQGRDQLKTALNAGPTAKRHENTVSTPSTSPAPSESPTTKAASGPAWGGARVASVTATSTKTIVALGFLGDTGACRPPNCVRLAQSRDGGKSFTALAIPADAVAGDADGPTRKGATDVRFGSTQDGWLYGGGLWSTHDGGYSWGKVSMSGAVTKLAAAHGTVWALVTAADGNTQQLWSSPVGSNSWKPVKDVTVGTPGDVALIGSRVVVIGAGPSKTWISEHGTTFTAHASPCASAISAELSASGSLWAKCATGNAAYIVTSADGSSWRQVQVSTGQGALPNSLTLGARGKNDAILSLGVTEPLSDLYSDGSLKALSRPPAVGSAISYLGFTSVDVGYAIDGIHLWRTNDGGDTWARLRIG